MCLDAARALQKAVMVVLSDACLKLRMTMRLTPASSNKNIIAAAKVPPLCGHCHAPCGPSQNRRAGVSRLAAKNRVQKMVSACVYRAISERRGPCTLLAATATSGWRDGRRDWAKTKSMTPIESTYKEQ